MQSTASSVLQTSFLITGGDRSLGGLKILVGKTDPQTPLSLFSAHKRHILKIIWQKLAPLLLLSDTLELDTLLL